MVGAEHPHRVVQCPLEQWDGTAQFPRPSYRHPRGGCGSPCTATARMPDAVTAASGGGGGGVSAEAAKPWPHRTASAATAAPSADAAAQRARLESATPAPVPAHRRRHRERRHRHPNRHQPAPRTGPPHPPLNSLRPVSSASDLPSPRCRAPGAQAADVLGRLGGPSGPQPDHQGRGPDGARKTCMRLSYRVAT